ncbi:hypothetical protein BpHYR1_025124 [Brachionus plicatilis]|uniref:Uncharacterized protein n=1 Tax=Brachionus plicatilis TaxID=10195 RepID=A0A3M7RRU8_BRAPC|nr:hypothetical protein BpHYR1_025124 [Brachionus plicatilis]
MNFTAPKVPKIVNHFWDSSLYFFYLRSSSKLQQPTLSAAMLAMILVLIGGALRAQNTKRNNSLREALSDKDSVEFILEKKN